VTEIKTVPYVPQSHPFVERLIGTIRREYLDHMLFWITCCSGRVQISRINCWISGPTSTTIAPITHGTFVKNYKAEGPSYDTSVLRCHSQMPAGRVVRVNQSGAPLCSFYWSEYR
jgi:hypothetical protein